MSRSEYSDDLDSWDLILWRGAVASAIRGKRGQAFLRELQTALAALPEKRLIRDSFAEPETGQVCALGCVAVAREETKGKTRDQAIESVSDLFDVAAPESTAQRLGISSALAKEIMFLNDDEGGWGTPEKRYERILAWVNRQVGGGS